MAHYRPATLNDVG